jgi:hypothetical protein
VPAGQRQRPARVHSISARLYIGKIAEHRDAFSFLKQMQDLHGAGIKTIVRALLHYRETVIGDDVEPSDPDIAYREFRPIPADQRPAKQPIKGVSVRLYVDKYIEHREAYAFLQSMQDLHGDGARTIVKALLHYRDSIDGGGPSARPRPGQPRPRVAIGSRGRP